jgi:linoleate 10R-lipoxygenase
LDVNLQRDPSTYVNYGWGSQECLGHEVSIVANTAILQCFALLPNLRRAPGLQGELKSVVRDDVKVYLQQDWGNYSAFPTSEFSFSYWLID